MIAPQIGDGTRLFGRTVKLVVGDLDVSDLHIEFKIKKTLKAVPNTAEIKVFNLSENSIRRLQAYQEGTPVKVLAGYGDHVSQIYLGETRAAWTEYDKKGETTTHLSTGTNAKAKKLAKIYQPVGANTPASTVLQNLASALGVPLGAVSKSAQDKMTKIVTLHPKPGVLVGNAWQLIDEFCRSSDLEFSIQDGVLQVLDYGGALDNLAFELSDQTGLLASPSVDIAGIVKAECLLIPDLRPGRKVSFQSRYVTGGYIVQEVEYEGSNFGEKFYATVKGKKY